MTAAQPGMDLAFFGLQEPAFNPTPDPRFLHLTPGHSEALAQLLYGVQQKKGELSFVLQTGGRSRHYVGRWDGTKAAGRISSDASGSGDVGSFELTPR